MKRKKIITLVCILMVMSLTLCGCQWETVPVDNTLPVLAPLNGTSRSSHHYIENMEFIATYDTGDYDLSRWRVTDTKVINMSAIIKNAPEGTTVLIEHVHIDISLKSTNPQLDGLSQDSMDDSYHGASQDGFFISDKYSYENKFVIEGFSKDLIDGWVFVNGEYGYGTINSRRLTENNLIQYGHVYANKVQVVYDVLIKNPGESYFHVVSILDEFLVPVTKSL